MSAKNAAQMLREKFGFGSPPTREETKGNIGEAPAKAPPGRKRKAEKMAQLNLRVPEEIKHASRVTRRARSPRNVRNRHRGDKAL